MVSINISGGVSVEFFFHSVCICITKDLTMLTMQKNTVRWTQFAVSNESSVSASLEKKEGKTPSGFEYMSIEKSICFIFSIQFIRFCFLQNKCKRLLSSLELFCAPTIMISCWLEALSAKFLSSPHRVGLWTRWKAQLALQSYNESTKFCPLVRHNVM